jgi:type IV secretion system protein VirB10
MSAEETVIHSIDGERDGKASLRVLSMQSRVSNLLAFGLMALLGLGSLTWYYATTLSRQGRAKETALAASAKRAEGDLPLPSLGRIAPVAAVPSEPPSDAALSARTLAEIPLAPSAEPAVAAAPTQKSPEQLELERRLSGVVFASQGNLEAPGNAGSSGADTVVAGGLSTPFPVTPAVGGGGGVESGRGESVHGEHPLAGLLRGSTTPAVQAQLLPAQRLLLPKGAFIDCTLETAIDSTLPGMTTCVMATDAFGVDGQVVLLERGTKLIGETRGQVQQGSARIFVLWTEARTPTGVIVPLDSPGADELGRSGLPGEVNTHFWQRFGAAILVSVIDGGIQAAAQSSNGGAGAVIVNPSASQDVLTEILKNTISIPPTVVKHNGDRIQVLVARDLDFRSVYELHAVATQR